MPLSTDQLLSEISNLSEEELNRILNLIKSLTENGSVTSSRLDVESSLGATESSNVSKPTLLQDIFSRDLVITLEELTANSELVKQIQVRLNALGLLDPTIDIDGSFGTVTQEALKQFCDAFFLDNLERRKFGRTFAKTLIEARSVTRKIPGSPQLGELANHDDNLASALKFTLKWEGGFVNHPLDSGGPTNKGIIQRVYDKYRIQKQQATQSVQLITDSEVNDIYTTLYWKPCKADLMVLPLAIVQFDTAVNFGVNGAIQFLQESIGLSPDGSFGQQTFKEFQENNSLETAQKMVEGRIRYRHQRVTENPSQRVFLQGWLNRDNALKEFISGNLQTISREIPTARQEIVSPSGEIKLNVTYYSQLDSQTEHAYRMCFSSTCCMALNFLKPGSISGANADDTYLGTVLRYGDTTEASAQIKALKNYGVNARFIQSLSFKDLDEQLSRGMPVAVGWMHKGPLSAPAGGHWCLVVGRNSDGNRYYFMDPYGEADLINGDYTANRDGRYVSYSRQNWGRRWEVEGPGSGWGLIFEKPN
jgi:lysozyme family protein